MKLFLVWGALNMVLAVALGAFGAHGLKKHISPELLATWNTSVLYHLIHALGLLIVGVLGYQFPELQHLGSAGWSLLAGILLFSGSLYLLVLSGIHFFGIITPFGGIAYIVGWLLLAAGLFRLNIPH